MADLEMTRRSLLTGLAALLSAPVKTMLPSVPETASGPRRWLWVHCTGWHELHNKTERALNFVAQRSDGEYFYVRVCERLEDLEAPSHLVKALVDLDMKHAVFTLNDFLNCDCIAGKPCARHTLVDIEEDEEVVA